MTAEFLKALGIEGDSADKIIAQADKEVNDISAKYSDYDDIKQQLDTANKKIGDFDKIDVDGLKKSAEDAEKKIAALQFDYALENQLKDSRAKKTKAVKALLDMDGLTFKDGKIDGLDKQLESITAENSYLFDTAESTPHIVGAVKGSVPVTDNSAARAVMGLK